MASLYLVVEDRDVRRYPLDAEATFKIGRSNENDIVLDDLALSRKHAEIRPLRGGSFEVVDLKSQNGVFLNGKRLSRAQRLSSGDTIRLGEQLFRFDEEKQTQDPRGGRERDRKPKRTSASTETKDVDEARVAQAPHFLLYSGEREVARFELSDRRYVIGRGKDVDIQVPDLRLSRRHCELNRVSSFQFLVRDLGSQNGTYLNKKRINGERLLRHGDTLNFAQYLLRFVADPARLPPRRKSARGKFSARPSDEIGEEENTELPEAYRDDDRSNLTPSPSSVASGDSGGGSVDGKSLEPIIESPMLARAKRAKKRVKSARPGGRMAPNASLSSRKNRGTPEKQPKFLVEADDAIRDLVGEQKPDEALDDWFSKREDKSAIFGDDAKLLLEQGDRLNVSQILSSMLLDGDQVNEAFATRFSRTFRVRVRHGREMLYDVSLRRQVYVIGSDAEADIQIRGGYVSPRHALLVLVRDSLLLVRLGSVSAVRVNGLPKLQAFLKPGDVVKIDEIEISVALDNPIASKND